MPMLGSTLRMGARIGSVMSRRIWVTRMLPMGSIQEIRTRPRMAKSSTLNSKLTNVKM